MIKILLLAVIVLILSLPVQSQVAINTDGSAPDASAGLDIKFTNKGFLPPRLSSAQRDGIVSPATGLLIFNTTTNRIEYFGGASTGWVPLLSQGSSWSLSGNSGIVNGTNFIGTTDSHPLEFRVNNQVSGKIDFIKGNTSLGFRTLFNNTSGVANLALGDNCLEDNTVGEKNVAIGGSSLSSNTTGSTNVAIGVAALVNNVSGYGNTTAGSASMYYNTAGHHNSAFGIESLEYNQGNYNTGFGSECLFMNINGLNNTAAGYQSLYSCSSDMNTALGFQASFFTSSGFQNTSLGANSLVNNTTGSYNTAIGYNTGPNTGNLANTTTLGIDARSTATDQVRIGNVFVNSIGGYVNWSNISDGRFKENLSENVPGLSFISQLRPVTYRLNRNAVNAYIGVDAAYKGEAMSGITTGFVAQEVEEAAQQLGYDFSGVDAPKNDKDVYALRYSDFVVPLVKAVQELDEKNKQLEKNNQDLLKRIELLEAQIGSR
jgi:hypothetical protein